MVDLSLTEFRIVALLAAKAGNDVGYREIYDLVHGKDFVAGVGKEGYRAIVRTLIRRIRKSFREVDPGFAQSLTQKATSAGARVELEPGLPRLRRPRSRSSAAALQLALSKAEDHWGPQSRIRRCRDLHCPQSSAVLTRRRLRRTSVRCCRIGV
jgi:hypothetical protein